MAVAPVQGGRVGSGFGPRHCHSRRGECFHAGWDFVGTEGDPIGAADAGTVVRTFRNEDRLSRMRGYGNVVVVDHHDGTWTSYNHMRRLIAVRGQVVRAGDQVGELGNTTNGKFHIAPHLHFEARHAKEDGSIPFPGPYGRYNIDPAIWFSQRGKRIDHIPGTLAGFGEESYEPDFLEPGFWNDWGPTVFGALLFNLGYRIGTGEWFVLQPFRKKKRRYTRLARIDDDTDFEEVLRRYQSVANGLQTESVLMTQARRRLENERADPHHPDPLEQKVRIEESCGEFRRAFIRAKDELAEVRRVTHNPQFPRVVKAIHWWGDKYYRDLTEARDKVDVAIERMKSAPREYERLGCGTWTYGRVT